MRYIKVLLLVLLIFFSLVFFFQNQTALSTAMTLKLNLFFVPEMTSIPLPFYFIVIVAFFVGALLAVALLLWDKMHLTARYMKSKWRVSALEREVAKLKKSLDGETARGDFLRKVSQEKAQAIVDQIRGRRISCHRREENGSIHPAPHALRSHRTSAGR